MARYEQNYTSESLREKENFITQVAVETRTPLTHALEQIKGVQDELFALMPGYQDGNSAAERAILKSMLQVDRLPIHSPLSFPLPALEYNHESTLSFLLKTSPHLPPLSHFPLQSIDSIQHATEVAISTFTDAIIINRLQQNQVVLTCVDTHPWTFLRDIALSFAVDAKRQRIEYGMTCEDYESGWTEANWIDIDTNKFGQVLVILVILIFYLFPHALSPAPFVHFSLLLHPLSTPFSSIIFLLLSQFSVRLLHFPSGITYPDSMLSSQYPRGGVRPCHPSPPQRNSPSQP